jgi:hypothetical protein
MHAPYIVISGHIKLGLMFQFLVLMYSLQYIKQNQSNFDSSLLSPHNLCNFLKKIYDFHFHSKFLTITLNNKIQSNHCLKAKT